MSHMMSNQLGVVLWSPCDHIMERHHQNREVREKSTFSELHTTSLRASERLHSH